MPGKGKPGTQPALPPTQPGTGAAVVCQRSTSSTSPLTPPPPPLAPRSALRLPLSSLAIPVTPAAHGRGGEGGGAAAPIWRLDLPRSAQPGTFPLPKSVCAEISAWDGVGGGWGGGGRHDTSPLCPAHPESAMYIYMFAHIPSPSFLLSLAIFFLSLCISFSVSLPSCFVRTNIAQSLIPICTL